MTSTAREYFHTIYAASDDPWNFAASSYEQRKYALTLDSLSLDPPKYPGELLK